MIDCVLSVSVEAIYIIYYTKTNHQEYLDLTYLILYLT